VFKSENLLNIRTNLGASSSSCRLRKYFSHVPNYHQFIEQSVPRNNLQRHFSSSRQGQELNVRVGGGGMVFKSLFGFKPPPPPPTSHDLKNTPAGNHFHPPSSSKTAPSSLGGFSHYSTEIKLYIENFFPQQIWH
jgi:hypothetical protein